MMQQHTPGEIRQFDLFKLFVFLALLATLLCLLIGLAGLFTAPSVTPAPSAAAPSVVPVTPTTATATSTAESTPTPGAAPSPTPAAGLTPGTGAALTLVLPAGKSEWPTGELELSGAGPAGAQVEVLDNGAVIGSATVDAAGQWGTTYHPRNGDHDFSARLAGASEALPPAASTVTNLSTRPTDRGKLLCVGSRGKDLGDVFVVGRCDVLSIIATRTKIPFAALLAANPQVHDPNLIYPGQILSLPRR
jgi:hypothetical protein